MSQTVEEADLDFRHFRCCGDEDLYPFGCPCRSRSFQQRRPRIHEGEAQQILALPGVGMFRLVVRCFQADSPDAVVWAGFDKHLASGSEQINTEGGILAELGQVSLRDQPPGIRIPHFAVEILDRASKSFCCFRIAGLKYAFKRFVVGKQPRLGRHHPVFRSRINNAFNLERRSVPLAQASLRDPSVLGRLVPPKVKVIKRLTLGAAATKFGKVEHKRISPTGDFTEAWSNSEKTGSPRLDFSQRQVDLFAKFSVIFGN